MRQHLGQTLRNPYLWKHWMDLYHFEFYGIVLTCSCATSWSFDLDLGFSRSNFENAVSGLEGPIDMERKGCESIGCYTHFVTVNVPLTHDLDLGFSRSNFEKVVSQEWDGRLTWTKGMWVDRMLHLLCDFQCPPHPWPWPWIFKVKFWKCCISGMEGPIDMEQKRCESIGCYTHFVTFNIPLTHDLDDLGFSRSNFENAVSQEWKGRLTWSKSDVNR